MDTGLYVEKGSAGWGVFHHSGLSAVTGLRQKRFAVEAMQELLATGVDFTDDAKAVGAARDKWKAVYYKWKRRAMATALDADTFEWYPWGGKYGMKIPSAAKAARMRQLVAVGYHHDDAVKMTLS